MEYRILIFGLVLFGADKILSLSDKKSSLTFVVDNTGSMQVDVHELNNTAELIFENVNSNTSQIDEFVLVTFNDPDVRLHNSSSHREDFKRNLGRIMPIGGGNCAEMSMSGIKKGLQHSLPGSLIWVFTDAAAADHELYNEVEALSQELGSQVVFAITGLCDDRSSPDYLVYHDLAISTNGQVFHLKKNEIGKLLKYVEHLIDNRKDIITSKLLPAGRHQIDVQSDEDIDELFIAVSGEVLNVNVRDPNGQLVSTRDITKLSEITVVKLSTSRKIGTFKLNVYSLSDTHVVISSNASIHFQHGFSNFVPLIDLSGTTNKPVPDVDSYLSIKLASKKDYEVHSVQILDMDDNIILEQPMKLVSKSKQIYTTNDKITPPKDMFKVAIKLHKPNSDVYLIKHGLTPIKPQNNTTGPTPDLSPNVTIIDGPTIIAGYYRPLQLKCLIRGYPAPSVIWLSDDTSADISPRPVLVVKFPDLFISVLEIPEVKTNATYTCTAVNSKGESQAFVTVETETVKVFDLMEIPEDTTIEYQHPEKITCSVEAFPPAKVTWYKNGKVLKSDGNIHVSSDGSTLNILSMEPYMVDIYKCSVANALDKQDFPFKLSISGMVSPVIDKTNNTIIVVKNSEVNIPCKVIAGIPTPSVHWFYNKDGVNVNLNINNDTIHLDNVKESNAGTYYCLADNVHGSDGIEIELIVEDICRLKKEKGPCLSSHVKWYYDSDLKQCRQFAYGGCLGNKNRFDSEAECRASCPRPEATQPKPYVVGKCELDVEEGPCQSYIPKWYYDNFLKVCRPFNYGGCQGNENRFDSKAVCENECILRPTPPPVEAITPKLDKCELDVEEGPCQSYIPKWYYDNFLKVCRPFNYGGCQGNENRFDSKVVCENECILRPTPPPVEATTPKLGKCELDVEEGPCQSYISKWYYDNFLKVCRPFNYGGCQGNENRFDSKVVCENECILRPTPPPVEAATPKLGKCELDVEEGPCQSYIPKWYYDNFLKVCRPFNYGGCQGNENRFDSKVVCENECILRPTPPPVEATTPKLGKCELDVEEGPCQSYIPKWYYDNFLKVCRPFNYGGCQGNENRFDSQAVCESECILRPTEPTSLETPKTTKKDKCQQPKDVGRCHAAFRRWFYDSASNECQKFVYSGCLGNENRFATQEECRSECVDNFIPTTQLLPTAKPKDKCELDVGEGPCQSYIPKWYYDNFLKVCRPFNYGGCQGNENRFDSQAVCENECVLRPTPLPVEATTPKLGKCEQLMEPGPCQSAIPKWYYNNSSKQCRRFTYGGCLGNENRFESEAECLAECWFSPTPAPVPTTTPTLDVCDQPVIVGPCQGGIRRWYYDNIREACRVFIYGGCNANENNFLTEAECQSTCLEDEDPTPITEETIKIDKCQLEMDEGPCHSSIPRWHYDSFLRVCREFNYGGCDGNENRFLTKAQCLSECEGRSSRLSESPPTPKLDDLIVKYDPNGYDPLILKRNDEFADLETTDGHLRIPANEVIKLVCPRKFQNLVRAEVLATYEGDDLFRIQPTGERYTYSDLRCREPWQFKHLKTGLPCYKTDFELSNVGFEIRGIFKEVYQICLHRFTFSPIYTKMKMVQSLPNSVLNKDSPWFDRESTRDLDKIYDCSTQNEQISTILNREFHSDGCCFAKRMLVNPLDVAPGLQATTYSYLNVAPHWSTCSSQNWVEVEERIRELRRKSDHPLEVLTGVAQELQLPDTRLNQKNITLTQSGKEFQVPKYFWKIVYDPHTKAALAIIQVNVPDLQLRASIDYVKCRDICRVIKWMNDNSLWRSPSHGFTYCCTLETFKSAFNISYDGVIPRSSKLLVEAVKVGLPDSVV